MLMPHISMIRLRNFRDLRSAFTLIELLVVIAIIAILASLLLPAVARAKNSAQSAQCTHNLRHLGLILSMYGEDKGIYPRGYNFQNAQFQVNSINNWLEKYWF